MEPATLPAILRRKLRKISSDFDEEGTVDAILMYSDENYWAAKDVSAKNGGITMFARQGTARTTPADAIKVKHLEGRA